MIKDAAPARPGVEKLTKGEQAAEGIFTMPIQDKALPGPFVWAPTEADRRQALSNHNQTLERLAERGGMSWCEMAAIVLNKPWRAFEQDYAKAVCRDVLINRKAFGVNVRPAGRQALDQKP